MTRIYHMTHVKNLIRIVACGEIICKSKNGQPHVSIAYEDIQSRRAIKRIPIAPYGTIHDYVPFYFAPRSPMLYAVHKGFVEGYQGGQKPIIYLYSSVERIVESERPFVFSDGNASSENTLFFNDLSCLKDRVDWKIMRDLYWTDSKEYPDRKRKRQAEFLVKDSVPWSLIEGIGVMNEEMGALVTMILTLMDETTPVSVQPDWYY